jgi:arsenate reductase-like glutaredoxin family protein
VFKRNAIQVREERLARKEPLNEKAVRDLLRGVTEVVIAKGKKTETFKVSDVKPAMLKGPSGNFRAPMLVRGKKMLVGFSADTLEAWFG